MARIIDGDFEPETEEIQPEAEATEEDQRQVAPDETDEADEQEEPAAESEEADDESGEPDADEGDEPEWMKAIDGDDTDDEAEDEDAEPSVVIRDMRKRIKQMRRENAQLRREREEAAAAQQQPEDVGPRPTMESCGWDEETYASELASYLDRKKKADERQAEIEEANKRVERRYQEKLAGYDAAKQKIKSPALEEAEEAVREAFSVNGQGVIVMASRNPERVVYALGKNAELRKQVQALESSPVEMAAAIAFWEGQQSALGKTSRKPRTKPEHRVKGSASTGKPKAVTNFERALENDDMTEALRAFKARG